MTKRWWLLVGAFLGGVTLLVAGFVLANTGLVLAGLGVGTFLYLGRRYFE